MRRIVLIATFLAAALCLGATAANAQPLNHHFRSSGYAVTWLSNHPDGGGNGTWATESFRRVFQLQLTGVHLGVYSFRASIADSGEFTTIPGAYTPNQGAPFTGHKIHGVVSGFLHGGTTYTFTTNRLPNHGWNLGIPFFESGSPTGPQTTSLWYEQAFPTGTVFGGSGIDNDWSWSYSAFPCFFLPFHAIPSFVPQHWVDGFLTDGQVPADGNITGC